MATKRPIKFRGRDAQTGEYRYGDLVQTEVHRVIMDGTNPYLVEPDSVAQLVGYDVNGDEVYEGDALINVFHMECTARLTGEVFDDSGSHKLDDESFEFILIE